MTNRCARPGFDTGPWAESSETVTRGRSKRHALGPRVSFPPSAPGVTPIFQSGPGSPLGDALWHLAFTARRLALTYLRRPDRGRRSKQSMNMDTTSKAVTAAVRGVRAAGLDPAARRVSVIYMR